MERPFIEIIFPLTDEHLENWRNILVTFPLPPFGLSLGAYALIMPKEKLIEVLEQLNRIWRKEQEIQRKYEELKPKEPEIPTGELIRTRPRNPNRPIRR
jgi:hypothetical protein